MSTRVLPEFLLLRPDTFDEALSLVDRYRDKAEVLAGGTDLLVNMKCGTATPSIVIGIGKVDAFNRIEFDPENGLAIGALASIRALHDSPDVARYYPVLRDVAHLFANVQLLNMGTVGGNICNASPAGDFIPPLLSQNAHVVLGSASGTRTLKLIDFFVGPGKTVRRPDELLQTITLPPLSTDYHSGFVRITRTAEDLAKISVATVFSLRDGNFHDVRISFGAVAPTVLRMPDIEAFLEGKPMDDQTIGEATAMAAERISPITDLRSTSDYRRKIAGAALRQSILAAVERSPAQ